MLRPARPPAAQADRPAPGVEILATDRPGSFLVRSGGRDQSVVDLLEPTRLEFDYVRRMGDVVDGADAPGRPLRVLHIGGAGLTLPRYVEVTRPGSRQIVLEPDEALTARVRSELPLPRRSGIRVRPTQGRCGLTQIRDGSVDVAVLDAYRDGCVPEDLLTVECFEQVARVLSPRGAFLANVSDHAPFSMVRDVMSGLQHLFRHRLVGAEPATLRGRRPGNVLVIASFAEAPAAALERGAKVSASPYRVLTGSQVNDSFGGGTPLRDSHLRPPAEPAGCCVRTTGGASVVISR